MNYEVNIYGLFAQNSMPAMQLLWQGQKGNKMELVKLARLIWSSQRDNGRLFAALMVITGDSEMQVYSFN